jgi:hypothetical protein
MNAIIASDKIFATVTNCGRPIFNTSFEGMTSLQDVVKAVSRSLRGLAQGMVTLIIRNGSQGWSSRQSLRLMPAATAEAVQLTLF